VSSWRKGARPWLDLLSASLIARLDHWRQFVNRAETPAELVALRAVAQCGRPFGAGSVGDDVVGRFDLGLTLRARNPPKREVGS
jgi:hypothetical protein